MSDKIRLGVIGANSKTGWAARSHLPAIAASPDVEMTAVCTTRQESAEETARLYGAKSAFHDYRDMLAGADLDAVAVVVKVPSHFDPTRDVIAAGLPVFTEWPLGRTTAEAIELTALARAKGVKTAVGLQARLNPALLYMKDLIAEGYVGDVLSCHVSMIRSGTLTRTSDRTWQRDATLGANTLTIPNGHSIDSLLYLVGRASKVSAIVRTQVKQWYETDTKQMVDVTSPDTILVGGQLASGGVFSSHVTAPPWAGSGYRLEIYGTDGTLAFAVPDSPQRDKVTLYGAHKNDAVGELEVPAKYVFVPDTMPAGAPYCLGQLYHQFAISVRGGVGNHPDFGTAVSLHHLVDAISEASATGHEVEVPTPS